MKRTNVKNIAVLDDYQNVAITSADWSPLNDRAEITIFNDHIADEEHLVDRLFPFDAVCVTRADAAAALEIRLVRLAARNFDPVYERDLDLLIFHQQDAAKRRDINEAFKVDNEFHRFLCSRKPQSSTPAHSHQR